MNKKDIICTAINNKYKEGFTLNDDGSIYLLESKKLISKQDVDFVYAEYIKHNSYQTKRVAEYPTLEECIHALLDGGDTLAQLQEKRQAVKLKYPKV